MCSAKSLTLLYFELFEPCSHPSTTPYLKYYFHLTEKENRPRDGEQVAQGDPVKQATEAGAEMRFHLELSQPYLSN